MPVLEARGPRGARPTGCWATWASPNGATPRRCCCPAGSSSASRWPGRWPSAAGRAGHQGSARPPQAHDLNGDRGRGDRRGHRHHTADARRAAHCAGYRERRTLRTVHIGLQPRCRADSRRRDDIGGRRPAVDTARDRPVPRGTGPDEWHGARRRTGTVVARRAGTGGGRRGGGHDHPASRPGSPPRYRSPRPSATSDGRSMSAGAGSRQIAVAPVPRVSAFARTRFVIVANDPRLAIGRPEKAISPRCSPEPVVAGATPPPLAQPAHGKRRSH